MRRMLGQARRYVRDLDYRSRGSRLLRGAAPEASPFELFGGVTDDWWRWANTTGLRQPGLAAHLPTMPDPALQRLIVGADGEATLREAFLFYKVVKAMADLHHQGGFASCNQVVDFGCGWGRIARLFLKDVRPADFVGLDCVESVLEVARETNRWTEFVLTEAMPPSPLVAGGWDIVYCYSVFSHLSEDAHLRWVGEFHRLLRPGGLLVATTRPRSYLFAYGHLRAQTDLEIQDETTSHAFPGDPEEWLARYDRGEFLYSGVGKGKRLTADFYGEALVPRSYAEKAWEPQFELVDHVSDPTRCWQDVLVARRRG